MRYFQTGILSVALALGGVQAASATTLNHIAWGTNFSIVCGANDALQFNATRAPTDGSLPLLGNSLGLKSDVTHWYPDYPCWESATWTSNGTGRRAAKLTGIEDNPNPTTAADFYLPVERFVKLRNLTIDNVDLDYDNTNLWFFTSGLVTPTPGISLTLNNGSITGLNPPAAFASNASLTLTATGDSRISNWSTTVRIASPTTLNVSGAGSRLTLFRVGSLHAPYQDALYFHGASSTATIDGGTLKLDQSTMTFGNPTVAPGQMSFRNGAALELTGDSSRLKTGDVSFTNSSAKLGLGVTRLNVDRTLTLDGASLELADSAKVVAPAVKVLGTNTIALPAETASAAYSMPAGILLMEPDSSLTLTGQGSLALDFELRWSAAPSGHYGKLAINDGASLVANGGSFIVIPGAPITINRTSDTVAGYLVVRNGGVLELLGSTGFANFINRGYITADADSMIAVPAGTFTILGGKTGLIDINEGNLLIGRFGTAAGAAASLITDNRVTLNNFSKLQLTLDPTARSSSQLRTSSDLGILNLAELNLGLVNDQVLPVGSKFVLIDYASLSGSWASSTYFNGYRDRSSFVLGLNRYQINYRDAGDAGYAGAVTLTVVPLVTPLASLSPTVQTLSGTVGANLAASATLVASNFGGAVTYSVNPALPAGLRLDSVTGVITGAPRSALATTAFTIRAVGATSGDANASVNLTVGKAGQRIVFGPAPAPGFAPGGSFLVSASATSGLPVAYSSLTPGVCSSAGSAVQVLTAGNCVLAANQAGDAQFNAAPQVTQTIAIGKASQAALTLFAAPVSIGNGQTSALSTSGGSGSGATSFAVSGPCSIAGTTLTATAAGTCAVTASKAGDANYNAIDSNTVNIRVGPGAQAALVLSASPAALGVNATSALSTAGGSGTGTVSFAVSSGPCSISGNTLRANGAGQCQVVATKAADVNFGAVTSNSVTLTVSLLTPPPLVLSASPLAVGFGGNSTLGTSGGVVGGAVTYTVTGPCHVDGNTLTGTGVGACQVTASQAASNVYNTATSNTVKVDVKARLTTFSYPAAKAVLGQPFTLAPVTAGFTSPSFALLYGNLPAWASLNPATGVISGTPTGPLGSFDFAVSVFENNAYDAALAVITVDAPPAPIPTLSEWGLILLSVLMALVAMRSLRRKTA